MRADGRVEGAESVKREAVRLDLTRDAIGIMPCLRAKQSLEEVLTSHAGEVRRLFGFRGTNIHPPKNLGRDLDVARERGSRVRTRRDVTTRRVTQEGR